MIVDSNFNKWNINKLKRDGSRLNESSEGTTVVTSFNNSTIADMNSGGIDGHYLWGQYFDATKDIVGDIDIDGDVDYSGNIIYKGDQGTNLTGNVVGNQGVFKNVASDTIENSGQINTDGIQGSQGIFNYGNINHLTSQDINVNNLTVTGSAHFFELVIDQIKSVGGAVMITPADGFTIYKFNQVTGGIKLWFKAQESYNNSTRSIQNKWVVGDQALIQSFNKSTTGASSDVQNTYFWSLVTEVSSQPQAFSEDDSTVCHYIVLSTTTYDGSYYGIETGLDVVMCGHRQQSNETAGQAAERQTAIYISSYSGSSGAYDPDLIAPFYIQYTGINNFNLSSHRYSWYSSGSRTANVPQNKFQGSFLLTAGQTVEEYIDDYIHDAGFDMFTISTGSEYWFVHTESNYTISDTTQTWNTDFELMQNGGQWGANSISIYNVYGTTETLIGTVNATSSASSYPYSTTIPSSGITITQYTAAGNSWNIQLSGPNIFSGWYGDNTKTLRVKIDFDDADSNPDSRSFDISMVKQAKGEDGSATQIAMEEFFLVPVKEECNVDATGVMNFNAVYSLKKIDTDAQGHTVINTEYTIPNDFDVMYDDQYGIVSGGRATKSTNQFTIAQNPYVSDYFTRQNKPTTVRVYLVQNLSTIDKRAVPVQFLTSAVLQVKNDAITAAVADSKTYTDGEIQTVDNSISLVDAKADGISSTVSTLSTTVNTQGGTIASQGQAISTLQQTATGLDTRVTAIETDGASKTYVQSEINQAAGSIQLTVEEDIEGKLRRTGIDITTNKITLDSENTDFLGNINMLNPNQGMTLYDEGGVPRVCIYNNEVTGNENLWETIYDQKRETKTANTTQTFTHERIPLGLMLANGTLTIGKSAFLLLKDNNKRNITSGSVSWILYSGTTQVHSGTVASADISINDGYVIVNELFSNFTTNNTEYFITITVGYTSSASLNGELVSIASLYRGYVSNEVIQLIGTDGAIFKSGRNKQLTIGSNIEAKNGLSNVVMRNDGTFKRAVNYDSDQYSNQWMLGEISSTHPYRVVSTNYTATAEDCIIQIDSGPCTITLPTISTTTNNFCGKVYYITTQVASSAISGSKINLVSSSNIYANGTAISGNDYSLVNRYDLYTCVAFPCGWIILRG